jgi:hypothetical protein
MAISDSNRPSDPSAWARRQFLKAAGTASVAVVAGQGLAADSPAPKNKTLPQIRFGKHTISRLVCGNNTFAGGSHLSNFVNHEMKTFFTEEQIFKTLRRCEAEGVTAWQATPGNVDAYRRYLDAGGKLHFLAIAENHGNAIETLAKGGCIGMAHHGEATDHYFKLGKLDQIHDCLKRVRDSGMMVGVSTHMPDVVDAIESKGWDLDYYMTCIYQRHRSEAELQKLLGHVPLPIGEVYLKSDPPRMFKMIQQTKRTCLAFKILAAGRLCDRRDLVEQAFRETLAAIKPGDGVIVGIYDRYTDQVAENADFVRKFG